MSITADSGGSNIYQLMGLSNSGIDFCVCLYARMYPQITQWRSKGMISYKTKPLLLNKLYCNINKTENSVVMCWKTEKREKGH